MQRFSFPLQTNISSISSCQSPGLLIISISLGSEWNIARSLRLNINTSKHVCSASFTSCGAGIKVSDIWRTLMTDSFHPVVWMRRELYLENYLSALLDTMCDHTTVLSSCSQVRSTNMVWTADECFSWWSRRLMQTPEVWIFSVGEIWCHKSLTFKPQTSGI